MEIYNNEFICTYKSLEDEYSSNLCYQIQLLQAFNMTKYDDKILQINIEKIYNLLRENIYIKKIYSLIEKKYPEINFINSFNDNLDNLLFLQILFSYDYFDLFHKELIHFFNNKNYNFEELEKLLNK
jgi:hypothetical protein